MQCYVYKGDKKEDHFLYLPNEFETDSESSDLPAVLLDMLGNLSLVIEFDLDESRKLVNADSKQVLEQLSEQGFYLQMPHKEMHLTEELYFN